MNLNQLDHPSSKSLDRLAIFQEGLRRLRAERQPVQRREADVRAKPRLHDGEEGGEGVRGVHQRPEQAGPLRPADRVGRRVPAGLVSVFDGRKFEFRPIKPIYST